MKPPNKKPNNSKPSPPHVYRPQPVPKVLQQKVAPAQRKLPVAPPVYKPQLVPKVLQAKMPASGRPVIQSRPLPVPAKPGLPECKAPITPLINRPRQPITVAQAKKPAVQSSFKTPKPIGPPLRLPGLVKATPRIGVPVRGAAIQRKIKFGTEYDGHQPMNEVELIEELVEEFGDSNRAFITSEVARFGKHGNWSMRDIWVGFRNMVRENRLAVHEHVGFAASHRAPSPRPLKKFSFTQVTYLTAVVGDRKFKLLRNSTEEDEHAEEVFMHQAEHLNLGANPRIVITLNNSPCRERCAPALAAWVTKHRLTKVTIFFGNPYSGKADFAAAIIILKKAGIRVHGIDLSRVEPKGEDLSGRPEEDLGKLGGVLRRAKKEKWYVSDDDSDSGSGSEADDESSGGEEDDEVVIHTKAAASARSRSRSRSRDRKPVVRRRTRRSARSRSPESAKASGGGGGGGGGGRSPSPPPKRSSGKRSSGKRPPRRAAAAAAAAAGSAGILEFPTWEEASYRKMRTGQRIRIMNHSTDISDRIYALKIDYDPSNYAYPEVSRHVNWINR